MSQTMIQTEAIYCKRCNFVRLAANRRLSQPVILANAINKVNETNEIFIKLANFMDEEVTLKTLNSNYL